MPFSLVNNGQNSIWVKSFWNADLSLIVSVDGTRIGDITSNSFNSEGYSWIDVNSTTLKSGNHVISIQNTGLNPDGSFSQALVPTLAIVPQGVIEGAMASAINAASDKNISLLFEAEKARIENVSSSWVLNDSFGLNASQGLAITSKAHSFIPYEVFVPKTGDYTLFLRANSPQISNMEVSIDNKNIRGQLDGSNDFAWFNLTTQNFSQGQHILQIAADSGVSIDLIMLTSENSKNNTNSNSSGVSYTENSPTNYFVSTQLKSPIFLFFSQPYNAGWKAYVNGTEIDSVPVCSGFNLFLLNENATGTVAIEFAKQSYFEIGLYASLLAISAIAIFCVYKIIRRRCIRK